MTAAEYDRVPHSRRRPTTSRPSPARSKRIWETKPGLYGWISTVDHKSDRHPLHRHRVRVPVARRHRGAGHARSSSRSPNQHVLTPEQYNQLFSMHGMTMIFLYALPVLSGFSNYLWPLVLGARDMAFPRLNALSYWIYLAAGFSCTRASLIGAAPNDGWFNYVPYALRRLQSGTEHGFLRAGHDLPRHLDHGRRGEFRRDGLADARARHVDQPPADHDVGNAHRVGRQSARDPAVSLAFFLLWMDRQFGTHFFDARAAASRCCGSTCSGFSRIPGSTSSCCRRWAWSPTRCRSSAAGRWSATRWSRCRPCRPWCSASASGCTTCSRPACRPGAVVLRRRLHDHRHSERGGGFRMDRDDLDRAAGVHHRVPVLRRLHRDVRDRRRVGRS